MISIRAVRKFSQLHKDKQFIRNLESCGYFYYLVECLFVSDVIRLIVVVVFCGRNQYEWMNRMNNKTNKIIYRIKLFESHTCSSNGKENLTSRKNVIYTNKLQHLSAFTTKIFGNIDWRIERVLHECEIDILLDEMRNGNDLIDNTFVHEFMRNMESRLQT